MTKLFIENQVTNAMAILGLLYPLCIVFISFIPSHKALALDEKDSMQPVTVPVTSISKIGNND
jgi:hypothetical protein